MRISRVEIESFKTIESIVFDLDKITVLIGENNSGKSNILTAIDLFFEDSVRGITEEYSYFKNTSKPINIILSFTDLRDEEKELKYVKDFVIDDAIRIKKVISFDGDASKYSMTLFGWQAIPNKAHFDLSRFDEYKADIKSIVQNNNLPEYFKNDKGTVTQASYKEGVKRYAAEGNVEYGEPAWVINPGGLKEVFTSLLPKYYLVPAVKDAQDESKNTQQTIFGKLINNLTNRIVLKNPKFDEVKKQIDGLKKYLNKIDDGTDSERLTEIKELENNLSEIIGESMPGSKVEIEIITPELLDLFKDTNITIDDSITSSINSKGHGLQRALIFAYIRAYAKTVNMIEKDEETTFKSFIVGIEEPELFLHPNGQRKMEKVLSNLSETDQVIYCTHSTFFVNMFNYRNIIIVKRNLNGPTKTIQYRGDIFETDDPESQRRLKKVFRYLSLFDLSRSEVFFSKKVVLVEGDTEKFIIPFWSSRFAESNNKYDLQANNICVIECGGKTNIHIFMRVLNKFKIPYIVIHDFDPITFAEDKANKTDKEKAELRIFKENVFIENTLDRSLGKIIKINPELENVIGVSNSQAEKEGKVGAAFLKYEPLTLEQYPSIVKRILDLILDEVDDGSIFQIDE